MKILYALVLFAFSIVMTVGGQTIAQADQLSGTAPLPRLALVMPKQNFSSSKMVTPTACKPLGSPCETAGENIPASTECCSGYCWYPSHDEDPVCRVWTN